jgi:hypothetical protein
MAGAPGGQGPGPGWPCRQSCPTRQRAPGRCGLWLREGGCPPRAVRRSSARPATPARAPRSRLDAPVKAPQTNSSTCGQVADQGIQTERLQILYTSRLLVLSIGWIMSCCTVQNQHTSAPAPSNPEGRECQRLRSIFSPGGRRQMQAAPLECPRNTTAHRRRPPHRRPRLRGPVGLAVARPAAAPAGLQPRHGRFLRRAAAPGRSCRRCQARTAPATQWWSGDCRQGRLGKRHWPPALHSPKERMDSRMRWHANGGDTETCSPCLTAVVLAAAVLYAQIN